MSIQDDLRKLTTGGPGVTHIASETLFNDAADEIEKLEFAITRWKKYEADAESEADALRATVARKEAEIAQWKKVYELRGQALARPCINCGHVPFVIRSLAEQVRT